MAWYYWVYTGIAIFWFLDLYSTLIRSTPRHTYSDLVVKPILTAFLAAIWPVVFVYLVIKGLREKEVAASD